MVSAAVPDRYAAFPSLGFDRPAEAVLDASLALEFLGMTGPDVEEGIASVKERRPPRFNA